ncbi:hypothetical protein ENUP19_0216G0020 [Entamoeba nuttalli]|uniref:Uncharacterized protein n=1 Tax=Entamoeba nuttalli TaxID=412467 RepID=A0ABQ0DPM2_9EUKA
MIEDNNQYNPIEINDNKTYNNYSLSIENENKDDQDSTKVETKLADEKKRLVEKEEESNENEKRTTKKRGKQTDRKEKNLTLYKCFALKLFERKLRGQLKEEIIERLIQEFGIKINDINEYKEILKKTFKIKNENKREINRIMEEEIIKHQWKDKELKEIISKMNKKEKEEIEEEEVMKIFKEEMKE